MRTQQAGAGRRGYAERNDAIQAARAGERKAEKAPRRTRTGKSGPKAPNPLSVVVKALSEAAFQRQVKAALRQLGYVVWTFPIMKRTVAGVPDLTFWNASRPGRLHFWELKTERGKVRPEQVVAIAHLATVPGVDARIVRPSEWPALRDALLAAGGER